MRLSRGISAIAVIVAAGLASGAALAQVTVGISLSTTGPAAALGVPAANMAAIMPQEIGGQKLRVIILDDGGDAGRATTNARRFVTEEKADIILGSSITPTSTSIGNVALESGTPHIAIAPVALPPDRMKVTFTTLQMPPLLSTPKFGHMQKKGVKTLGVIGFSDSWGDLWIAMYKRFGEPLGIKLVADERYGRADSTVTGQVLKVLAQNPDAVLIAASGTGAALPQIALRERGYKGLIYQTAGAVSQDMLRVAGKSAEGLFASTSPAMFPEVITDPKMRAEAEKYVKMYEDKYGANTRNQFAPNLYDAWKMMERVIPVALKSGAKPGTPEFRAEILKAMESEKEVVGAHGYYNFTPTDHAGLDARAVVMVTVKDGKWVKAD